MKVLKKSSINSGHGGFGGGIFLIFKMAPYQRGAVSQTDNCQAQPTDGKLSILSIWQSLAPTPGSEQCEGTLNIL